MRREVIAGMQGPYPNPVDLMNFIRFESIKQVDAAIVRKSIDDERYRKFRVIDSEKPYTPAEGSISVYIEVVGAGPAGKMEYHVRLTDHKSSDFRIGISIGSTRFGPMTKIFRMEDVNSKILLVGSDGFRCWWSELDKDTDKPRLRAEENNVDLSIGHRMRDPAYYISKSVAGDIANRIRNGAMEMIADFLDDRLVADL